MFAIARSFPSGKNMVSSTAKLFINASTEVVLPLIYNVYYCYNLFMLRNVKSGQFMYSVETKYEESFLVRVEVSLDLH